jgi:hypothetical protein
MRAFFGPGGALRIDRRSTPELLGHPEALAVKIIEFV